jgi:acetylornithine aminotransferase
MQKKSYLTHNYAPLNVSFVKGEGCYLFDKNHKKYLDALSGVGVCSLGHTHPDITTAITQQAQQLLHTSNWYHIENQEILAEKLCTLVEMENVFFSNSGAEANEAAIKATRLFARKQNIEHPVIITMNKSFHGRTMATLSATGNDKVQQGFAPLVAEFVHIDFNNIAQLKELTANHNVVAVMLEPILGESGVIIPDDDYLQQVRTICDAHNWLMICDEVQTGIGRTGEMFAYNHSFVQPDILTLAKGLGGGVAIGATLFNAKTCDLLTPGTHGSTFGGNPLATKVATTVLDVIKNDNILENVSAMSEYLAKGIAAINTNTIKEVRIKGLMIGIETHQNPAKLLQIALDEGLLINITGNTIRMLPPLILTKDDADVLLEKLEIILHKL